MHKNFYRIGLKWREREFRWKWQRFRSQIKQIKKINAGEEDKVVSDGERK